MSFRLRIFLLVMVVAGTAIGATAWLTLSLTSRALEQSQQATATHRDEIVEEISRYGRAHGRWPGVDQLTVQLATQTGLHIRLTTFDAEVLTDSDAIQNRDVGPVRPTPALVDPRPWLASSVVETHRRMPERSMEPGVVPVRAPEIFGAPGAIRATAPQLMVRQLAQYRAALITVRCIADKGAATPALTMQDAPYLTDGQRRDHPECVATATERVAGDEAHTRADWTAYTDCLDDRELVDTAEGCLQVAFNERAAAVGAVPLQLFFGAQTGIDLVAIGRPAALGVGGLLLVALAGTALIARRISRPVQVLTDASKELAAGKLDVRVPAGGTSELARLSKSFNAMAEAVQRSEERQRRLVADVAHEMRTPLSNLRGYLEGLSDGVVEPSRELFASLHEETLLQRRILDDLQVLALAETGNLRYARQPVNLSELAEVTATTHRVAATEAGIELDVEAAYPAWVDADPDRIRQVLSNLLTNALRYTDPGGRVRIAVRPGATLAVTDTGVGMSDDERARVFDRFWRADPARQRATGGSGLGLTIAHRIVTDHGGRLEVASEPGRGSTFTVHLPEVSADRPPSR